MNIVSVKGRHNRQETTWHGVDPNNKYTAPFQPNTPDSGSPISDIYRQSFDQANKIQTDRVSKKLSFYLELQKMCASCAES